LYKKKRNINNNIRGGIVDKIKYKNIADKYTPKENRLYNALLAFLVGGLVGVIGELIIRFYANFLNISEKDAGPYMMITLIFIGCLLTCLGFFDKWVSKAKAGLIIPITGFAHSMMSATLEYKKEGLVTGIGASMLKLAGTVIIFGVISAYIFGLIRLLIFGG
jgi:stage V sporulation protein AC